MSKSPLPALMIAAFFTSPLSAREAPPKVRVGDDVVITMSGRLAEDYMRITTGKPATGRGLEVQLVANVAQLLPNGQLRLEASSSSRAKDQTERMVTITATCYAKQIMTRPIPKGTPVYASPAAAKDPANAKLTTADSRTLEVELSGLKGLKIRIWTLAAEIGE